MRLLTQRGGLAQLCVVSLFLVIKLPAQNPFPVIDQTKLGTISGQLLNTDGTPAARVQMQLETVADPGASSTIWNVSVDFRSDSQGRFRFNDVYPGRYKIVAGLWNHRPTYYPGTLDASAASTIRVGPGEDIGEVNFTMARPSAFRVSGKVRRPEGSNPAAPMVEKIGLTGALLTVTSHGGVTYLLETPVSADGSFEFRNIPEGEYKLYPEPSVQYLSFPVLVAEADLNGLDLVVPLESRVVVTVVREEDFPMPPLEVFFEGDYGRREAQRGFGVALPPPAPPGKFRGLFWSFALPAGGHRFVAEVPPQYFVKSVRLGTKEILEAPFTIDGAGPLEIVVTLAMRRESPAK